MVVLIFIISLLSICKHSHANIDADKASELSREIREHFRLSGANWVSPKMFQKMNLLRNEKPIIFVFTSRSCMECREFMDSWTKLDRTMLSSITAQFLAVLVLDDYALEMAQYSPADADYLPRVVFANPDGTFRDIRNTVKDENIVNAPYFYDSAEQVVAIGMRPYLAILREEMGLDMFPAGLKTDI